MALEGAQSAAIALDGERVLLTWASGRCRRGGWKSRARSRCAWESRSRGRSPGAWLSRRTGAELRLVTTLPLEEAVAAIVAPEAGGDAPAEARKAQAIASRSFLLGSRGRHAGYQFCDTTHCQHFTAADAASRDAAEATAGMVLTHAGAVIEALSTRRCGGTTRTLRQVGLRGEGYPYFPAACEPCRRKPFRWERSWPAAEVAALMQAPGSEAARLEVVRRLGWSAVPSNAYALRVEEGTAVLAGEGEGHGVGLCQFGAAELARQGWDAGRILGLYFVNARIERR